MTKKITEEFALDVVQDTDELALDEIDLSGDMPVPIEKLLKWRNKGLSYQEIGNHLAGVSKQAIHQRLAPYRNAIENLPAFKEHRADLFAVQQSRLLNSLTDKDIKSMEPASRVVSAGILYDKERLEEGKSTSNQAITCRWIGEDEEDD